MWNRIFEGAHVCGTEYLKGHMYVEQNIIEGAHVCRTEYLKGHMYVEQNI